MKKRRVWILVLCLAAVLAGGCARQQEEQPETKDTVRQEETEEKTDEKTQEPETEEPAPENQEMDSTNVKTEEATVYFVTNEGSVEKKTVSATEISAEFLWGQLQETGSVSKEARILSMNIDDQNQMDLDVNEAFGEQLRSQGSAGEEELLTCVVNSFLDTFSCEKVRITENGDVLVSGHKEYGDYIRRME